MAVERNPFANVINLNADPMEEAVEFEIELEDEDGELIVEDMMEEAPYDHYANLIYELDEDDLTENIPKCSELYISTKTKNGELNQEIDLKKVFWKVPIIEYQEAKEGILKKQMKIFHFHLQDPLQIDQQVSLKKCTLEMVVHQLMQLE